MITNIAKWGNSMAVRIPQYILKSLDIADSDELELFMENEKIVIKKAKKKYKTIQERFKGFDGVYEGSEINWGDPVGNEVW